jgi:hypothetical protein
VQDDVIELATTEREGLRAERHDRQPNVLVEVGVEEEQLVLADGPSWLKTSSPCQSLRITWAKSSICAVVTDGTPKAPYMAATPRPMPSVKRPFDSRCMVVATNR